jgi:predicted aspartyl protease
VAEYENLYVHVIRNKTTIPILELNDAAFEKNPIEIIKLKKVGYHYFIMVRIGIKDYTFLFDTGATDFLINKSIEKDLIESGIIKKEDYMGVGIYEIANGQKIRIQKVRIRKIKIGNII